MLTYLMSGYDTVGGDNDGALDGDICGIGYTGAGGRFGAFDIGCRGMADGCSWGRGFDCGGGPAVEAIGSW